MEAQADSTTAAPVEGEAVPPARLRRTALIGVAVFAVVAAFGYVVFAGGGDEAPAGGGAGSFVIEGSGDPTGAPEATTADDGARIAEVDAAAALANYEGTPASGLAVGDPDAPVTIRVYTDMACTHCRTAALEHLPELVDTLVGNGGARLDLVPIAFMGASSERGALGVLAAAEQDAGWPFADLLFRQQEPSASDWVDDALLGAVAQGLGLDVEAWRRAYFGDEVVEAFKGLRDAAQSAGIDSAPTFVITGPAGEERIEGAVEASILLDAVTRVTGDRFSTGSSASTGEDTFAANCAACHMGNGRTDGGFGPQLASAGLTLDEIRTAITDGVGASRAAS